ncbi:MAG TPA: amidohydrolase family protein [Chloroflexota bacterium]|nr:amidohydrolase family protein [Chloroflexota bacterium]
MKNGLKWMDSDMHLAEPWDLWQSYVEPELREQVPELTGIEPGHDPLLHGPHKDIIDIHKIKVAAFREYMRPDGKAVDPEGQLRAMDREGIDMAILYPTIGLPTQGPNPPGMAAKLRAAYNSWLHDFCSYEPSRLKMNAMIATHDIDLAVQEIRRSKELGAVSFFMDPRAGDTGYDDPVYEPIWAEAEKLDLAIGFHGPTQPQVAARYAHHRENHAWLHSASRPVGHMFTLMELLFGGVLERHPTLRVVFLEAGASWVPFWLFRLEEEWEKFRQVHEDLAANVTMPPLEYWKRQCFCSVEVDEWSLQGVVASMGDETLVVSSDFPHFDCAFPEAGDRFLALPGVSLESKRRILWDNCARLYNLN